jgi:hypothetical protein
MVYQSGRMLLSEGWIAEKMMPASPENDFDDPQLKDAVRRCWACDCAPENLQKQVARLLADSKEHPAGTDARSLGKMRWAVWPVALAAGLMLAAGLFHQFENRPASIALPPALPVALEHDLIHRHDLCSRLPDHQHLKVPKNDDTAITAALHTKLKRAVLVFHPRDPQWQFRGAAICPVGTTPAGHLVFVKGNEALSIFSLPKSLVPNATDGEQFAADVDQHCIVGFIKDGALFCAVSSGPFSIDQLKAMEARMEPVVAAISNRRASPLALAELLQPVAP